ncbi:MAG: hypothetical protein PUB67_01070 [Clostridiales bacterium]|nr:hypothetical protein [Clostridiales bacterium]
MNNVKKALNLVKKAVKNDTGLEPEAWPGSPYIFYQPKRPVKKNLEKK